MSQIVTISLGYKRASDRFLTLAIFPSTIQNRLRRISSADILSSLMWYGSSIIEDSCRLCTCAHATAVCVHKACFGWCVALFVSITSNNSYKDYPHTPRVYLLVLPKDRVFLSFHRVRRARDSRIRHSTDLAPGRL